MHPYKRKRRTRRDMFVLGGWLFADLLLGLAMLFAVANTVGQAPPTPTPTATPNLLATAESDLALQQAENQQTVVALQQQLDDSAISAQQTQEAADDVFAAATEQADAEATRAALTDEQRATADAQATEDAVSAQATINALATEQASSDSDVDSLSSQLATTVALATQSADNLITIATQQAEVQAIATENADSGANAEATSAALRDELAASEAQASSAQATSDAVAEELANAEATSQAAGQQVADAQATASALDQQVQLNSLNPVSITEIIQVDLGGVLGGNEDSLDNARNALDSALGPYADGNNCRIGFVNISSRSNSIGEGVQLSDAIAILIEEEHPELLPDPADGESAQLASESIAFPNTSPVGEVQLQLFLSTGCQPAG
jgi:hypothetical protein